MGALLSLKAVVAGYGQAVVLRGLDLDVEHGEITCLIGPNGAGKSTVLKAISGLITPREGVVEFAGEAIGGLSPREILARGIVQLPQERSLFPDMTVWDNLLMGAYLVRDKAVVRRRAQEVAELYPIVARRRKDLAGSLSGGEQRRVELARTLMADPALVLLDEPSIGLDPKARRAVFDAIVAMNRAGRTVLLVEQNARSALAIAHRGVVLEAGRARLTGSGRDLLGDPEVGRLYLGAAAPDHGLADLGGSGDGGS